MQLGLLESCVQGRFCSPDLTSSRLRHGAGARVAQLVPLRKLDGAGVALSSSASLFSRLSVRGGLPALKVQPRARNGGVRVEASGAYSKEAFVSEGEASKLAQVSLWVLVSIVWSFVVDVECC